MKFRAGFVLLSVLAFVLFAAMHLNSRETFNADDNDQFRVTSSTFQNKATLPRSMIFTSPSPSNPTLNACTFDGSPGGDQSPELSWSGAPQGTRSFVVLMYDPTASFTHWGMYNISPKTTSLPVNAGVAGSPFGVQVSNDFGNLSYDGPCPPTTLTPLVHHYVFTVYALDEKLPALPASGNFHRVPKRSITL